MGSLRSVATIAAIAFLVQGIVWAVVSFLAILAHYCHFEPKGELSNNPSFSLMVKYYFSDESCWPSLPDRKKSGIIGSDSLILLVSFQFTFNLLISIVGLILLFVIPKRSTISFLGWLYGFMFLGFAVCVTDIVTSALFSKDIDSIEGTSPSDLAPFTIMLLILSLVAGKGYIYWALNVSLLLYIFLTSTMRLFKACRKLDESKNRINGSINTSFEGGEREAPAHSAVRRWPGVGKSLWKEDQDGFQPPKEQWEEESNQRNRDRAGFGSREGLKQRPSFREAFSYMDPSKGRQTEISADPRSPVSNYPLPSSSREQRNEPNMTRPNSLQEAILTIKPLRQVRPKLSELQNRY